MAQEVQAVMPEAVTHGSDGKLRVFYDKLRREVRDLRRSGCASGAHVPAGDAGPELIAARPRRAKDLRGARAT